MPTCVLQKLLYRLDHYEVEHVMNAGRPHTVCLSEPVIHSTLAAYTREIESTYYQSQLRTDQQMCEDIVTECERVSSYISGANSLVRCRVLKSWIQNGNIKNLEVELTRLKPPLNHLCGEVDFHGRVVQWVEQAVRNLKRGSSDSKYSESLDEASTFFDSIADYPTEIREDTASTQSAKKRGKSTARSKPTPSPPTVTEEEVFSFAASTGASRALTSDDSSSKRRQSIRLVEERKKKEWQSAVTNEIQKQTQELSKKTSEAIVKQIDGLEARIMKAIAPKRKPSNSPPSNRDENEVQLATSCTIAVSYTHADRY